MHYSDGHARWNIEGIRSLLLEWIIDQIYGMQPALNDLGDDSIIWAFSPNGAFSTHTAYELSLEEVTWILYGNLYGGG